METLNKTKRGRKSTPKVVDINRFRSLVDKTTRQKVAEGVGCDTSTVTKHYLGYQGIDIEFLLKYAQFFGVSSDYLLGLSDICYINQDPYKEGFRDGISHTIDHISCKLEYLQGELKWLQNENNPN